jgi:hypothetical protein
MPDEHPILGKRAKAAALLPRKGLATDSGREGGARSTAPTDITGEVRAGFRVCAKINSEECRRDFGGRRGASDEHIRGICKERATKPPGKRTRQNTEFIFAQTLIARRRSKDGSTANLVVELAGFSQAKQARHCPGTNPLPPSIGRAPEQAASETSELPQIVGEPGLAETRNLNLPPSPRGAMPISESAKRQNRDLPVVLEEVLGPIGSARQVLNLAGIFHPKICSEFPRRRRPKPISLMAQRTKLGADTLTS